MAITLADFNKIWASTSPLTPYSFSESNYKQGWNFIGSTPPARQMWDFLQKNNDEKMQYLANNYLPLTGGTVNGQLVINRSNSSPGGALKLTGAEQNYAVVLSNTSVTKGNAPSTDKRWGIEFYGNETDSWQKRIGLLETFLNTGKLCRVSMTAYNCTSNTSTGSCEISCNVDESGTVYTSAPTPANGDNSTKIATTAFVHNNYLPLSGGTMTGAITSSVVNFLKFSTDGGVLRILGCTDLAKGSVITLTGKDLSGWNGKFQIQAHNGSQAAALEGNPDGTLTWNGQPIQTSSDKRLKQDFSNVPSEVLETWGKVNWQQFKYIDDAERKGVNNCRFHTGLVAQDVKKVGEENNVDLLKYGILCHDVREATEDSEAVDLWTIRYEEALAMEAAYQRRRADRLEERIARLEALMRTE